MSKTKPQYSSEDVMELLDKDPDDLMQQLTVTLRDIDELREYADLLKEVLGQKCLDEPDLTVKTSYGSVRYNAKQPYRRWDRERISEYVYRRALDGKDFEGTNKNETQRVYELFSRVFRFEPKIGEVKKLGGDKQEGLRLVEDFSSTEGESRASVTILKEDN